MLLSSSISALLQAVELIEDIGLDNCTYEGDFYSLKNSYYNGLKKTTDDSHRCNSYNITSEQYIRADIYSYQGGKVSWNNSGCIISSSNPLIFEPRDNIEGECNDQGTTYYYEGRYEASPLQLNIITTDIGEKKEIKGVLSNKINADPFDESYTLSSDNIGFCDTAAFENSGALKSGGYLDAYIESVAQKSSGNAVIRDILWKNTGDMYTRKITAENVFPTGLIAHIAAEASTAGDATIGNIEWGNGGYMTSDREIRCQIDSTGYGASVSAGNIDWTNTHIIDAKGEISAFINQNIEGNFSSENSIKWKNTGTIKAGAGINTYVQSMHKGNSLDNDSWINYGTIESEGTYVAYSDSNLPHTTEIIIGASSGKAYNVGTISIQKDSEYNTGGHGYIENPILKIPHGGNFYNFGTIEIGENCILSLADNGKIVNLLVCNFIENIDDVTRVFLPSYDENHYNAIQEKNHSEHSTYIQNAAYYDLVNDTAKIKDLYRIYSGAKVTYTNTSTLNVNGTLESNWNNYISTETGQLMELGVAGDSALLTNHALTTGGGVTSECLSILAKEIKIIGQNTKSNWDNTALKTAPGVTIKIGGFDKSYQDMTIHNPADLTTIPSDARFGGSLFSIDGYKEQLGNVVEAVDTSTKVEQNSGYVRYYGDNSWYNGLFIVHADAIADVDTLGAMFGGNIELKAESTLIWRGGPKDPYNKPIISMENSSVLSFILPEDDEGNKIFSVYGKISTTGDNTNPATINIESGTIYIKSDCSNFKGHLKIQEGAMLVIRKDTSSTTGQSHEGKMFGGTVEVVGKENGQNGQITIDTDNGLIPLRLKNGRVVIQKGKDGIEKTQLMQGFYIEKYATLVDDIPDAEFYNFVIDGGRFELGPKQDHALFSGTTYAGSTINTKDGVIAILDFVADPSIQSTSEDADVYCGESEELKGHLRIGYDSTTGDEKGGSSELKWHLDLDPQNNSADKIRAVAIDVASQSKGIVLGEYGLLSEPLDEEYVFKILDITGAEKKYPTITVPADNFYSTNYGVYELLSSGANDGNIILRLKSGLTGAYGKIKEVYLPMSLMHSASLSVMADMLDAAYDKSSFHNSKYHVWNKSMCDVYDFIVSSGACRLHTEGKAVLFGADFTPFSVEKGTIVASAFAGCSRKNFQYDNVYGDCFGSIGGLKLSWLNKDYGNVNMVCSYSTSRTGPKDCLIRAHQFSIGARYSNALPLGDNVFIVPLTQLEYLHTLLQDTQMEHVRVNHQNYHNMRAAAGLSLQFASNDFKVSVGTKFIKKFGRGMTGKYKDTDIQSPQKIGSSQLQISAKICGKLNDNASVDLTVGKYCSSRKGTFMNFTLSMALSPITLGSWIF
jgi:hypothetical protein